MAINKYEQTDSHTKAGAGTNVTNNSSNESNMNGEENNDKNDTNKTNKGENSNTNNSNKNNNNKEGHKIRVSILTPGDMATYTFTISWRPE
jgi:hypothetical protein